MGETQLRVLGMQRRSRCGYCQRSQQSRCFGMEAARLLCSDYEQMINRGWRRSGSFLYLTDHSTSCCSYYPIRTHALTHQPRKTERRLLRRWHRMELLKDPASDSPGKLTCGKRLRIVLEPAAFSEEKFLVFERYQKSVHDDDATRPGFRNFLCDSPLVYEQIGNRELPHGLGSYHQCYYVDGRLAAVGVIDILPSCISSVYLFYDPEYSALSLGTFSSLREIALVHQLHQTTESIRFYYMGYYIPSCPKMTYKGQWRPAELLDLVSLKWIPIDSCLERIRKHPVFCTFDPYVSSLNMVRDAISDKLDWMPVLSPSTLSENERKKAMDLTFHIGSPRSPEIAGSMLSLVSKELQQAVLQTAASLGLELASRAILLL
ncbi:Arginyl-tRNA--protein transferase 1 [Coemansia sp. RSA 990]|nr:arginine-tRNA-protein transferase [Coemansia mojavensis]KAJ1741937.1 Arginyl-tRNA--protein transferase 1 [Coemansia sp. RSA 1086]KAJ1872004.1 Arginyl-tRNA--protein transferase 1 [Coemansia sp. RSA 990]